jgi:hypothetical protein
MAGSKGLRGASLTTIALAALIWGSGPALAAPLPPVPPLDVCGVIQFHTWLPPRSLPPVAGMSGSASRQRQWPGRFVVVMDAVRGGSRQALAQVNALLKTAHDGAGIGLKPGQLLLVLADDDPARLTGMKSLCVTGFVVSGDEGGTWTRHAKLTTFSGDYPGEE